MNVLRIEHLVANYEKWKDVFDSDPLGREKSGVKRYRVMRATDDPNYVLIDLEFETQKEAEAVQEGLRGVWGGMQGLTDPRARVVEVTEFKEF